MTGWGQERQLTSRCDRVRSWGVLRLSDALDRQGKVLARPGRSLILESLYEARVLLDMSWSRGLNTTVEALVDCGLTISPDDRHLFTRT
jgi:hypothetical protein